jgi:hypothetical protein
MPSKPLLVVAGALAHKPFNGGAAWTRLSWVLGFRRLGYDVCFVEQISPSVCVNRAGEPCPVEESTNLDYFVRVARQFDVNASLLVEGEMRTFGLAWEQLLGIAAAAEMLINISGHLTIEPLKSRFRRRVFIDLDPGYTQFWHAQGLATEHLRGHDAYFTVGENIGRPFCAIPTGGISWRPIRQPVVLDQWPVVPVGDGPVRFTTIASWRGPLGRAAYGDRMFGVKAHEFRNFRSMPSASGGTFEVALDYDPADRRDVDLLVANGWSVVDPRTVVPDPLAFRNYVQQSSGEFSVAQGVYVDTQSGWFSDRTVRYLASGRPALVQDTGWSRNYPSGRGLVAFNTLQDAIAGVTDITANYDEHARAARRLAEEMFSAEVVLPEVLQTVAA